MSTQTKYRCPSCRFEAVIGRLSLGHFETSLLVDGLHACPKCNHEVRIELSKAKKPLKQRISRQRRQRLDKDAEYNAMRDIYLEQNPECVCCRDAASQVHHIVGGTAGRSRSLLNSDTWLGLCAQCHDGIGRVSPEVQAKMKQAAVKRTIERLRA